MHRHLLPFPQIIPVPVALIHDVQQTVTSPQQHSDFPILAINNIFKIQSGCTAYVGGLLAVIRHVKGNSALSLRLVEYLIHDVEQRHRSVHLDEFVLAQVGFVGGFKDSSLPVEHPVDGDRAVSVFGGESEGFRPFNLETGKCRTRSISMLKRKIVGD